MITLFHSPNSRSTAIVMALEEMGLGDKVDIRLTRIPRQDGSGGRDPANPHPDGKVPALDHDGVIVSERPAILTYLSDLFPDAPGVRPAGHPQRGAFLTWLAYYGDVVEPVFVLKAAELDHPFITAGFRGYEEVARRLTDTLSDGRDYLLPDGFSTADLLMASPFLWLRDFLPDDPLVKAWFDRVTARPSVGTVGARDQEDVAKVI